MASIRQRLKESTYQLDKSRRAASIHPERFSNALIEAMCDGAELHRENESERRAAQLLREATLYAKEHRKNISESTLKRLSSLENPTAEEPAVDTHSPAPVAEAPELSEENPPPEELPASTAAPLIEDLPVIEPGPEAAVGLGTALGLGAEPSLAPADVEHELRAQFETWKTLPQTDDPDGVILQYQDALEKIRQSPDDYSQTLSAEIREAAGKIYLAAGKLWDAERMFLLAFRNRLRMGNPSESATRSRKTLRMLSEVYDEAGERRIARSYRDVARLKEDGAVLEAVEKLLEEPAAAEHAAA